MTDRLLDPTTVARRLGVVAETVRGWIRTGKLEAIRTPGGYYKIRASALATLLQDTKTQKSQNSQTGRV